MGEYIIIADVLATSLTRGEYNKMRGWIIPENENPMDDGYFVEYYKNGKMAHTAWVPKEVFEKIYERVR